MYFISIHGSYNKLEVALFRDTTCLKVVAKHDIKASSHLIPIIDQVLIDHNLSLADLTFIAVDKGPGAFTSLRVTIATVNGIAFAYHIPLLSVSGLDALWQEVLTFNDPAVGASTVVCLLNAYNEDVYYLIGKAGATSNVGCRKIEVVCADLRSLGDGHPFIFVGDGVRIYRNVIDQILGAQVQLASPFLSLPSAQQVGLIARNMWVAGQRGDLQVMPLYLKTQLFAVKK